MENNGTITLRRRGDLPSTVEREGVGYLLMEARREGGMQIGVYERAWDLSQGGP